MRGADQIGQIARIVREVGVHLDQQLGARRHRAFEARQIGLAETALAGSVEHLDRVQLRREGISDRAGPVRRVVVHDEHPVFTGNHALERGRCRAHDAVEIRSLVVGRDYQPDARHSASQRSGRTGREPAGWARACRCCRQSLQAPSSRRVLCHGRSKGRTAQRARPRCSAFDKRFGREAAAAVDPPASARRGAARDRRRSADHRGRRRRDVGCRRPCSDEGGVDHLLRPDQNARRQRPDLVCDHRARGRERRHHAHDGLHAVDPDRGRPASRDRADVRRRSGAIHTAGPARARARTRAGDVLRGRSGRAVLPRLHQRDRRPRLPDRGPHRKPLRDVDALAPAAATAVARGIRRDRQIRRPVPASVQAALWPLELDHACRC